MEIRLLVNGNLVHNVAMADLQLITSKRDIYFATTVPEFIPKDFRIKGLENEQDADIQSRRASRVSEFSNERILEIKHKIDKLEALQNDDQQMAHELQQALHINPEDSSMKFLPIPRSDQTALPCIQRARSLQKSRDRHANEEKRLISKSNSYGDSCTVGYGNDKEFSLIGRHLQEPAVPPNSPKMAGTNSIGSPTRCRTAKSPIKVANHEQDAPEKCKPLRIFRIPLANLTGTHSHYHTHSSTPRVSKVAMHHKIEEDGCEFDLDGCNGAGIPIAGRSSSTSDAPANSELCDSHSPLGLKTNLKKISSNCANLSLFSSI